MGNDLCQAAALFSKYCGRRFSLPPKIGGERRSPMFESMRNKAKESVGRFWNRVLTTEELSLVEGGHAGPHCGVGEPKPVGAGSPDPQPTGPVRPPH
jgi:hypothetical protein